MGQKNETPKNYFEAIEGLSSWYVLQKRSGKILKYDRQDEGIRSRYIGRAEKMAVWLKHLRLNNVPLFELDE